MLAGAADAAIIPTGIGGFIACKVGGWERGQGGGRGTGGGAGGAANAAIIPTGIGGFIACKVSDQERGHRGRQGSWGRGRGSCRCGDHPDWNRELHYRQDG